MDLYRPGYFDREAIARVRPRMEQTRCAGLFVSGSLDALAAPCVAIVGSRAPSELGRRLARSTAQRLARSGVCVVSGLALGIDAAAHEGALDAGAPTVGVLGGGHRRFFPRRNVALAERIIAGGGAVVSPFEPDHRSQPFQFLQRNAIIAALADAVAVVEAAERSGSLNTASWATDLGLPVFAFPGDVDRPKVAGCLALLRDGATLVRGAGDILEGLGLKPVALAEPRAASHSADEPLIRLYRSGVRDIDALIAPTGLPAAAVSAALTRLELEGLLAS
jgi:DNA processing protein